MALPLELYLPGVVSLGGGGSWPGLFTAADVSPGSPFSDVSGSDFVQSVSG